MNAFFKSIALVVLCTQASAHTVLLGTSPKNGSTVAASPSVIEIQFRDPARLTSAVVVDAAKQKRKLEFKASDKANGYILLEPLLSAGRNEVQWKALSKDGHVINGTLVFTVKPAK